MSASGLSVIGGDTSGRIDGFVRWRVWPGCSVRRHRPSAGMPGASVPGGRRGDSGCVATDNL